MKKSGWVGVGHLENETGREGQKRNRKKKGKERKEQKLVIGWFGFGCRSLIQSSVCKLQGNTSTCSTSTPLILVLILNLVAEPQRQTSSTNSSFSVGNPISKVKSNFFFFYLRFWVS